MRIDNIHIPSAAPSPAKISPSRAKKVPDAKKEALFSEFHALLGAGVDLNRAFGMLVRSEKEKGFKTLLEALHRQVVGGSTLWQALSKNDRFSSLDSGVVRIGEETGKLHESLAFLSEYYRKKAAQRRMISGAVSYPAIILVIAVVVLVFMILVVVPMFEQVYARMGGELPAVTRAVIAFSRNFKGYLSVVAGIGGGGALLFALTKNTERAQRLRAGALLRLPAAGELLRMHYQSHFCKLMYLLYSSGVPLLQGVEMLRGIIVFYPYRRSFEAIAEGIRRGESFAANLARHPRCYDPRLSALLGVGEQTNTLAGMLRRQGDELTATLEHRLKQLGNLLEPVLILFVGVLVALVLISMYMPMFKLGTTIY